MKKSTQVKSSSFAANFAIVIMVIAGFGIATKMYKKMHKHRAVEVEMASTEETPEVKKTAPIKTAALAKKIRLASVAPAALQDAKKKQADKFASFTKAGKVKLNIAALLKNKAFRDSNPDLTLEKFENGEVALSDIKLPQGTKLSYELDPKCAGQQSDTVSTDQISKSLIANMKAGAPAFVSSPLAANSDVQSLSDKMTSDPCIQDVAFDDMKFGQKRDVASIANEAAKMAAQVDKSTADQAVVAALSGNKVPVEAVIGLKVPMKNNHPDLFNPDTGKSAFTVGAYPLQTQNQDGTVGSMPVPVVRHPYALPAPGGQVQDTAISNTIVSAVKSGAKVITVNIPNYDPVNFQAAIQYANQHGAVVVGRQPVPPKVTR